VKISYTQEAIADLERLRSFIEPKNTFAARRISSELLDGIGNLHAFPKMGLPVARAPDPDTIRDLFIGQYTVRYLLDKDHVVILRIWHGKEVEKDL
jgi:plasmid stabilization system protein ParE